MVSSALNVLTSTARALMSRPPEGAGGVHGHTGASVATLHPVKAEAAPKIPSVAQATSNTPTTEYIQVCKRTNLCLSAEQQGGRSLCTRFAEKCRLESKQPVLKPLTTVTYEKHPMQYVHGGGTRY